ncbi:hypothetical protein AYI68_g7557 [Smittium mucronatum]|uniref:Reverse transcriptase/retrotransposon-derived protein RNase H-like domain-containing protein n=1 Tax=Smittium mucronatum TaxID=133383 RepID=A0A1R0GNC6_9FUNG|nr:hypothetical protein AYI68_g7557 [Smittium mucronatum]
MYNDASNFVIGASIYQNQYDGSKIQIAYYSRKLLPEERTYCTTGKESLSVVTGHRKLSSNNSSQDRGPRSHKFDILAEDSSDLKDDGEYDSGISDSSDSTEHVDTSDKISDDNNFNVSEYPPPSTSLSKIQQIDTKCKILLEYLNKQEFLPKHIAVQSKSY